MATKYVRDADGHGWLMVRYEDGSTYPPLPMYTKVEVFKVEDGREHFRILEGRSRGKVASVRVPGSGGSYLADARGPHGGAGSLHYDRTIGALWYGSMDRTQPGIACKIYPENPPPLGTHALEIPDEVHDIGSSYLSRSRYATTWFRIGHSGDRYLHPGTVSLGCVTVEEVEKWTNIYNYLIGRRLGDGKSVGRIRVFAQRPRR